MTHVLDVLPTSLLHTRLLPLPHPSFRYVDNAEGYLQAPPDDILHAGPELVLPRCPDCDGSGEVCEGGFDANDLTITHCWDCDGGREFPDHLRTPDN